MIEHLVLIKPKAQASEQSIATMIREIQGLKAKIPVIKELSAGLSLTDRHKGYTVGVRVLLESPEHIDAYRFHQAHVAVLEDFIKPTMEDIVVVDYHHGE